MIFEWGRGPVLGAVLRLFCLSYTNLNVMLYVWEYDPQLGPFCMLKLGWKACMLEDI